MIYAKNVGDKLYQQIILKLLLSTKLKQKVYKKCQLDVNLVTDMVVHQSHQCENPLEI